MNNYKEKGGALIIFKLILLSALAGTISGFTGIGGGVLFTPLFKMLCDSGDFNCLAADTVYLSMIVVLCSNTPGLLFSSKINFVPFNKIRKFLPSLVVGLFFSQLVIFKISPLFHDIFLAFLVGYINLLARFETLNFCFFIRNPILLGAGIGFLSGLGGIGGSLFFIPIWHQYKLSYRQINAANTTVVLLSSLVVTIFAFGRSWQPPIDVYALMLVIFCATIVNFTISRHLKSISEDHAKMMHYVFFNGLFFFYLIRVLFHVLS